MSFFDVRGLWQQVDHIYGELNQVDQMSGDNDGAFSLPDTPFVYGNDNIDYICRGTAYFDVIIVCSIATSSLSRTADSIIANNARELFRLALWFAEYAVLPNTVIGLQAILFFIQYATMNPSDLSVWYLVGVGMRIYVDLGLHQDPPAKFLVGMNKNMLETRRRLFWATYSFDRSCPSVTVCRARYRTVLFKSGYLGSMSSRQRVRRMFCITLNVIESFNCSL